jgi:PGF-pre-PGF domain-containing protein
MTGDKHIQNSSWQGWIAALLLILAIIAVPAVALGSTDLSLNTTEPTAGVLNEISPGVSMEDNGTPEPTPTETVEEEVTPTAVERLLEPIYIHGDIANLGAGTVIPSNNNVLLRVSNDETARFNDYDNNTYHFFSPGQSSTQGMNALHITTDPVAEVGGQITFSKSQSGIFYLTDDGGRGWDDNGILMLAVNGTIPNSFRVTIKASGYQWTPVPTGTPTFNNITYVPEALNETFTKDDFIYGPQIWRPCTATNYPIFYGQDMTDTENTFSIIFIDLNAGILGGGTLNQPSFSGQSVTDNGAIKVEYAFENLPTLAAFNAYAYTVSSSQGQGIRWTNRLSVSEPSSGYTVIGQPLPEVPIADFTVNVTSGDAPLAVQFNDASIGSPTSWAWDFENDGTIDSTEQNPTHTYTTAGTYTVNLTVTNDAGSDSEVKTDYIAVSASQPEGTYYVDASGSGDFLTIQDAVDHAGDGDTIIIRDGTYPECVVVNRPLTITSANGSENTIVSPSASSHVFTIASNDVTIRGLGIVNANGNGIDGLGYRNCVIEDNVITGTGTKYGIYLHPGNYSVLRNNVITSQKYGVMITSSSGDIIENNTISGSSIGINVQTNSNNMTITENTIVSTGSSNNCISLRIYNNIEDVHVEGNSISGGQITVVLYKVQNILVLNNGIIGGSQHAIQASDVSNADIRGNTIITGTRTGLYAYRLTGFKVWLNNFTEIQSSEWGLVEVGIPSLNSITPVTYTYANATHTGYLGNYYSTYTGTDSDDDGVGDMPFVEEKVASGESVTVYDHHPLISPPEYYRILTIIDVGSISISPPSATLGVGESRIFTAELFDPQGEKLAGVSPLWSSSNTTVGVVNEITGSFEALAAGTTVVTAAAGSATDTAEVTVSDSSSGGDAPTADFTANVISGDAPLAVAFTDASTGSPTSWAWDFENDGTIDSAEQNPTHTYTTAGTYTVNLTVTSDAGSNSAVKTDYIVVTEPPAPQPASIVVTPSMAELTVGTTKAFAATVYDTDGGVMDDVTVTWTSSNVTVGTLNTTVGLFTARAPGTTTITAAYANVAGTATVTVTPPQGDQTQNTPLDIPGCNVTTGNDGRPQVSINTTATNATVNGTTIRIAEGNFTLTIETEGAPTNESGTLNGTIANIRLDTNPVVTELGSVGTVSASVSANLTGLPQGAGLTTTVSQNISADAESAFQLAATADGLTLGDVAYTMNIVKTNLDNGQDIAGATIRMAVSPAWVTAHGGVDAIRIIRFAEDGTKEVLATTLVGTDASGNLVFEAVSPNGLSIFGLAAATAASQPTQASSSSGGSSGTSTAVGTASNLKAGESATLPMRMTAVSAITVTTNNAVKDVMVTVAPGALPRAAEPPAGTLYQYVQATLYKAAEDDLAAVQLRFAVPAAWLTEHGCTAGQIAFLRHTADGWQNVPVEAHGDESGNAVFTASPDAFGLFAITVTGETPASGDATPKPTGTEATPTADMTTPPADTTPATPQATPLPVWAAVLAFGVLLLVRRT